MRIPKSIKLLENHFIKCLNFKLYNLKFNLIYHLNFDFLLKDNLQLLI